MCACVYVCICACSKRQASGRHHTRGIECAPSCIGTSLSVDTLTTLMLIYQTNTTTNPETSPHPLTARLSLATAILIRRHRGFPWWQSRRSAGRVHVCMCVCMHMCMWLSLVAVSPIGRPCACVHVCMYAYVHVAFLGGSLADRQAVCNALARAKREGRLEGSSPE